MSLGGALSKSGALSKVFGPICLSRVFCPIQQLLRAPEFAFGYKVKSFHSDLLVKSFSFY